MKDYNWRQEREKYQPAYNKSAEPVPAETTEPPVQSAKPARSITAIILIIVVIIAVIIGIFTSRSGGSAAKLASVAEKYQKAVGLVTVTVEMKNGEKIIKKVGTAWAFDSKHFATNAHVAHGLKGTVETILKIQVINMFAQLAKNNNCASIEEFIARIGKEKAEALRAALLAKVIAMVNNVHADILINGTRSHALRISHVQVHRDYGVPGRTFDPDVAVFTIEGKHDCFFELAGEKVLHNLKSGEPVAFLGFPVEDLQQDNVNLENPIASMQSGIVVAVSDFDMKDSGPAANQMIRHNLPATGGASGSAIFNSDGKVVALLYSGNIVGQISLDSKVLSRAPSAAQINFGVRVDLLSGLDKPIPVNDFLK